MNAGYTSRYDVVTAIMLGILAKGRAEVAPGVGKATDVVLLGPDAGRIVFLPPATVEELENMRDDILIKQEQAVIDGINSLRAIVNKAVEQGEQDSETPHNEGDGKAAAYVTGATDGQESESKAGL